MTPFMQRLSPAPRGGGFRRDDSWIWCGSVVCGDDGRYHMFASMWSKDVPFNPNWLTNSRVVRAVSDSPAGPYSYAEDVLPPRGREHWDGLMTHNPTIHKLGGTFLLFYTGTTFDGPVPDRGNPKPADAQWPQARANQRIGLATAPSVLGPWKRLDKPILEPRPGYWDALITTNPAPCVLEDGRVLLLYKSATTQTSPIMYGMAMGDAPAGPYCRLADEPFCPLPDKSIPYEDAYVWREDAMFQVIFNDMTGKITGEDHAGAHAMSQDGVHWRLADSPKAYSRNVLWDDGSRTLQGSFERPQLLIEDGHPTHLFAATADGPGGFWQASNTWNMVVPLRR